MAGTDWELISDAERQHVLDALQRRVDNGNLTPGQMSAATARVYAAQTHAGLDAVLMDMPPETPWTLPTAPPPPVGPGLPWWQRPVTIVVAAGVVGAAVVLGVIVALARADTEPDAATRRRDIIELPPSSEPSTSTTNRPAVNTQPPTTATPPFTTLPLPPAPSLETKDLRVGQDIQPGRYMSNEYLCYWERVTAFGGGIDNVIANGGGPHAIVDIQAGDFGFRVRNCDDLKPYAPPAAPATSVGDGDWLVGSDIVPGTYTADGTSEICMWERASGFGHDFDEVGDYGFEAAAVNLSSGQRFTSFTCGTWTKTG
jgi:hypothetical protein